ncbi:MAG: hypothetical protein ACE5QV_05070 [Fidelibacterota bacterium]
MSLSLKNILSSHLEGRHLKLTSSIFKLHDVNLKIITDQSKTLFLLQRELHSAVERDTGPAVDLEIYVFHQIQRDEIWKTIPSTLKFHRPNVYMDYAYNSDMLFLSFEMGEVLTVIDPEANMGLGFISKRIPLRTEYLLNLIILPSVSEILKKRGYFPIHAAGLQMGERGLIFPGATKSGKTTLSMALLFEGFKLISDDLIYIHERDEKIYMKGEIKKLMVPRQSIFRFFPEYLTVTGKEGMVSGEKVPVNTSALFKTSLIKSSLPGYIITPQITIDKRSELMEISRARALEDLICCSLILTGREITGKHFRALARLVKQCTCYRLILGTDLNEAASLLKKLNFSQHNRKTESGRP